MLRKVSIAIYAGGYAIVAYAAPENEKINGNQFESHQELVVINSQCWELKQAPFSELVNGKKWDELELSARYVEALERAAVASSKLARRLEERKYDPLFSGFALSILPGRIEMKVEFNHALVGGEKAEALCCYEWDEHRQMLPLKVLRGDASFIPDTFLKDIKEACFGRYGLLARQLERVETHDQYDNMGAMRWA